MRIILWASLLGILVCALYFGYGCAVTPESYVLARVNGQPISLKDVIKHPQFRSLVREIVTRTLIRQKAAQMGITVDEAEVKKKLEEMKAQIGPGPSWERYMQLSGITEEQLLEEFRIRSIWEEYLKRNVNITDEEIKARFDSNPRFYKRMYGTEKSLTDEESDKLSYEDIKDWLKDYIIQTEASAKGQDILDRLLATADIDYLFLPPEERKRLAQEQMEARKAIEKEDAEKAMKAKQGESKAKEEKPAEKKDESAQGKSESQKKPNEEAKKPESPSKSGDGEKPAQGEKEKASNGSK